MVQRRKTFSNNDVSKQLDVVKYPHSTATSAPKIPDGSITQSLGQRFHEYDVQTTTGVESQTVILYPGLQSCGVITKDEAGTGTGPTDSWFYNDKQVTPAIVATGGVITMTSKIRKWRMVSCGIKIRSTNNTTENSGTWSARRVTVPTRAGLYRLKLNSATSMQGVVLSGAAVNEPNAGMFKASAHKDSTTFASGKISEIGKQYFQLQDQSQGAHDMVDIPDKFKLVSGGMLVPPTDFTLTHPLDDTVENSVEMEGLIDRGMDAIVISFKGHSNCMLSFDMVANYELVFGPSSEVYSYMSETSNGATQFSKVVKKLRFQNKLANKM